MSNTAERQSLMILDEKVQSSLSAMKHIEEPLGAFVRTYETAGAKWPHLLTTTSHLSAPACRMSYMSRCFDYKLCK